MQLHAAILSSPALPATKNRAPTQDFPAKAAMAAMAGGQNCGNAQG
jgi:hypothetical protein